MNTRVRVFGIPKQLNKKKLTKILGSVLKTNMKNVFVENLPSSGSKKDVLLTFTFPCDAQLAKEKLDDFVFTYNNQLYVFTAKYDYVSHSESPGINNKGGRYINKLHQDRQAESIQHNASYREIYIESGFQNTNLSKESSDLDRQIEILKKQRMILEEERKLLEEQQKLQEFKMKIQLSTTKSVLDSAQSSQPDSNVATKPVYYYKACGVLIRKMNKFISQYSRSENRKALLARLRTTLSNRIITLVDGQPIYQTHKVIELYRNRYPESEDESLVKEVVQTLDETLWAEGELLSAELEKEGENAGTKLTNIKEKETKKDSTAGDNPAPAKQMCYFQASKLLLKRMNKVLDNNAEGEKRKALVTLLRYRVKDRFAAAIAGRPIYNTFKVLQVYREVYPISEDDEYIKGLLKEIDENNWTIEDIKEMNNKWNKSDTVAENADGAGKNDTAKEEETNSSVEKKIEDQSETDNKEDESNPATRDNSEGKNNTGESETVSKSGANNSENKVNSIDGDTDGSNKAVNNEATKPDTSVENINEEASNGQHSVNDTTEDPICESMKQNHTEDTMADESRGVKRKCNTVEDGAAKLARIWEEDEGDLDVTDELSFEDWS